jgi:NDP-sugar pyrophosphorylase family protein
MMPSIAILAGGLATRLGSIAASTPKILLDVVGRPFAERQLALIREHGLRHVVYCVGHLGAQVETALGDGSSWGMRFDYVHDGESRLGTGGALVKALPLLSDEFLVLYGDSYLDCDYGAVASALRDSPCLGLMTVFCNEDRFDRSNVQFEHGLVLRYDKKHSDGQMRHIDYGLGGLKKGAFARREPGAVFDLADLYQELLERDELAGLEVFTRFYEIGSPQGLAETRALLVARETKA